MLLLHKGFSSVADDAHQPVKIIGPDKLHAPCDIEHLQHSAPLFGQRNPQASRSFAMRLAWASPKACQFIGFLHQSTRCASSATESIQLVALADRQPQADAS